MLVPKKWRKKKIFRQMYNIYMINKTDERNQRFKWWGISSLYREKLHAVRMPVLSNMIYRFSLISIKIWASYFVDGGGLVVKSPSPTLVTPWTVAHQAPLYIGFPRQEYWSGLPFPSPGESSQPRDWTGISCSAVRFFTDWAKRKAYFVDINQLILKFVWKGERPRLVNAILKRKNKVKGLNATKVQDLL